MSRRVKSVRLVSKGMEDEMLIKSKTSVRE